MSEHDRRDPKAETKVQCKPASAAPVAAPAAKPAPMGAQRQSAARQINRSLKAWRDKGSAGGGTGGVSIPSGGGGKLPGGVQSSMERKLGADLSDVNIHTGGDSAGAAKDLNARAFTTGTDVHFGAGEFDPGSKEGKKLLAHELTHVVQAKRSGISRAEDEAPEAEAEGDKEAEPTGEKDGESLEVSDPEEPAEKEADAVAEKVTEDEGEGGEVEGEEAKGEAGGGEKAEEPPAEIAAKSIPISAKLKGIGLKVFRSGPPPVPGAAPAADPKVQEAKTKAEDLTNRLRTAFAGGSKGSSAELAALLMAPDVTQLVRANPSVKEVQDLKAFAETIRESVEDLCQADVQEFGARLKGLSAEADDATAQLTALKSDPKWLAWHSNPLIGATGKEPNVFVINMQSEFPKKEGEIRKAARDKELANLTTAAAGANGGPQGSGPVAEKQKELAYKKDLIKLKSQELAMSADFWQKLIDIGAGIGIDVVSETTIDSAVAAIVVGLTVKFPGIGALSAIPAFALSFAAKQAVKTVISGAGVDGLNMALEKMRSKRLDVRLKAVDTLSDAEVDELAAQLASEPSECFDKLDSLGKERVKMEEAATAQAAPVAAAEDEKKDGVVKKLGKEAGKRALFDAAGELMKKIFVPFASIAEKVPEVAAKLRDVKKVMDELKMLRAEIKAVEGQLKEMASAPPPAAS